MNVGGMHIFGGLGFLLLCWFVTFFYVVVAYFSITGARYLFSEDRRYWSSKRGVVLKRLGVAILVLLCIFYLHQRLVWMKDDNKYYAAKEYWVAGRIVNVPRKALATILPLDFIIIHPYTFMHRKIYNIGKELLPEKDGERYIWYNEWFVYPYARNFERPRDIGINEYEPEMVRFLDSCWKAMEHLTTYEIADPDMKRKHLLGFSFLVSYYNTFQGHYTGKFVGSGARTLTHPLYRQRNFQMLDWLDDLKSQWHTTNLYLVILRKYPYVAALQQTTVLELLQNIALALPLKGTFHCDHPIIDRLYKELQDIMSNDPKRNTLLYLNRKNKKQAGVAYSTTVYSFPGSGAHYMLGKICNKKMPQELKLFRYTLGNLHWSEGSIEEGFSEELEPLLKR